MPFDYEAGLQSGYGEDASSLKKMPLRQRSPSGIRCAEFSPFTMIESLEARIAPAALISFTEIDGDLITIKTNKGTNGDLATAAGLENGATGVNGFSLRFIKSEGLADLFAGTNVTITAKKLGDGNGRADKVVIDASDNGENDIDLGKVTIKGNIQQFDAGDANLQTLAVKKLTALSFTTGVVNGESPAISLLRGDTGAILVKGDFNGHLRSATDIESSLGATIASLTVNGDIATEDGDRTGFVEAFSIGALTVKGTFFGSGDGSANNGLIRATAVSNIKIAQMSLNARIDLV